jgi:hypothetical protein
VDDLYLSTRRGDAEAFQGIDGDQLEPVVDGCLKRIVPGVFVTSSADGDGSKQRPRQS